MENRTPEQKTREKLYKLQDKINKGKETGSVSKQKLWPSSNLARYLILNARRL